jgi:hypothetical protein
MKINKEEIPVAMEAPGTIMRSIKGFGGMTVGFNQVPAGTDFAPLLQGLRNNSCQCPHWGYMVEGELIIKYDDGKEETLTAGDIFYMPPGHTAAVTKDMKFLDFSPEKELDLVMEHIAKKMAEISK